MYKQPFVKLQCRLDDEDFDQDYVDFSLMTTGGRKYFVTEINEHCAFLIKEDVEKLIELANDYLKGLE